MVRVRGWQQLINGFAKMQHCDLMTMLKGKFFGGGNEKILHVVKLWMQMRHCVNLEKKNRLV